MNGATRTALRLLPVATVLILALPAGAEELAGEESVNAAVTVSGEEFGLVPGETGKAWGEELQHALDSGMETAELFRLTPEPFSDDGAMLVSLEELLELAVTNNYGLRNQQNTIEKNHFSVDRTYYRWDPQWSGDLRASRSSTDEWPFAGGTDSQSYSASTTWSKPFDNGDAMSVSYGLSGAKGGGGFSNSYSQNFNFSYTKPLRRGSGRFINNLSLYSASNSLQLSYDSLDNDIRQLKLNVINSYYRSMAARESINVRRANLETALLQLDRAMERLKVGLGIPLDVLQAENSVISQGNALIAAIQGYHDSLDQLTVLVGLPQEFEIELDMGALEDSSFDELPPDLWELVKATSFTLRSIDTTIANLKINREATLDQMEPRVDFGLSIGRGNTAEAEFADAILGLDEESITASISWSLDRRNRDLKANLAQTQLDLENLQLNREETLLQLKQSLRSLERELDTRSRTIELQIKNVQVLRETLKITEERQRVGLATTLDVIDAQDDLLAAELSLLQARVSFQETYRSILVLADLL
ncbi:TolC family protein [bacterium]|nr:TolC family protein [bacterium]